MSDENRETGGSEGVLAGVEAASQDQAHSDDAEAKRRNCDRQIFMLVLSLVVVVIVLMISFFFGEELFMGESKSAAGISSRFTYLLPYATCLAGVLIFIMSVARKKGDDWDLRGHWGEHLFRIPQAFAYLFIVMWAWAQGGSKDVVGENIPPNIIGFLVGLFILRVEKAMEGFGVKLEEILMSILPRSLAAVSAEEKRRQHLRTYYRLDEITQQYEAIRAEIDDPGAKERFDLELDRAREAVDGDDPDKARREVQAAARGLDEMKRASKEVLVPLSDLIGGKGAAGTGKPDA
jgi:hypothetical protein